MRRAYNNVSFIEENDVFYGISLGYDYCAEHEWGIEKTEAIFGLDKSKLGIEGGTITKNSTSYFKDGDYALLRTSRRNFTIDTTLQEALPGQFFMDNDSPELQTSWSDGDFGILVKGLKNIRKLELLRDAFSFNDVAITRFKNSKNNPFENTSLSLVIVSLLPEYIINEKYISDKKVSDLNVYCDKIGMTELLSGRREYKSENYFMACSPKWINYENEAARDVYKKESNTEFDVIYWVNYSDDDNNYGWYTVEEIKKWQTTPGLKLAQIRKKK